MLKESFAAITAGAVGAEADMEKAMGNSMERLVAGLGEEAAAPGGQAAARRMAAALPADRALELQALAAAFGSSSEDMAGRLLGAAIADAWDALDDGQMLRATRACRRLLDDDSA